MNFDQPKNEVKDIEEHTDYLFNNGADIAEKKHQEFQTLDENPIDEEARKFFSPIYPEDYDLADVKKMLEEKIETIQATQDDLNNLPEVYAPEDIKNNKMDSTAYNFQIRDMEKWIGYIDFYLNSKSSNPMDQLKNKIENEKNNIDRVTKKQNYELN